tara:strand:- start:609 stop:893 length:285 start_codon:yes stop_codon:yes gene_type:complete
MKIKELLELQEVITKRATPSDMDVDNLEDHYSTSKDEYMNILDMDLIHLIRSYSKCLGMGRVSDVKLIKDKLRENLDSILTDTYSARELLDKTE